MSCIDPKDMPPYDDDDTPLYLKTPDQPLQPLLLTPMDTVQIAIDDENKASPILVVMGRNDLDVHPMTCLSMRGAMALVVSLRKALRMAACLPVTPPIHDYE
jgi:hypothetical protein